MKIEKAIWKEKPLREEEVTLTVGVADAAVADARAAPPLHRLQVLVVPEVSLLHGRREVFYDRVELAQDVAQVLLLDELPCKTEEAAFYSLGNYYT